MSAQALHAAGFYIQDDILSPAECLSLSRQIQHGTSISKGSRNLLADDWCAELAQRLKHHPQLQCLIPADFCAVQCSYFEKSQDNNWLVSIHQDLSIPVAEKRDAPGYSGWSIKQGTVFVQPPLSVLQALVAVRLHIDECGIDDGALRVLPGSHQSGRVSAESAASLLQQSQSEVTCLVKQGGVLVMKPLLLHASSKSTGNSQRRVLHFLYGPTKLPGGVAWQHKVS